MACCHSQSVHLSTLAIHCPQDRVRVEAEALVAEAAHCPQHVPEVYHYDARMCIIAMQVGLVGVDGWVGGWVDGLVGGWAFSVHVVMDGAEPQHPALPVHANQH